jgi:hypothetical protein
VASKFLINHFDHVSDALVGTGLNKPFSEVALDGYVKLLLLVTREVCLLNLGLDHRKCRQPDFEHIVKVGWAKRKVWVLHPCQVGHRVGQDDPVELNCRHDHVGA